MCSRLQKTDEPIHLDRAGLPENFIRLSGKAQKNLIRHYAARYISEASWELDPSPGREHIYGYFRRY